MWGQLLGMDFIEEQNLTLSIPSYSLRNWNTALSLEHSSVELMRKEGLWWQASHQVAVWLTRWWFWQQHPLSSPRWHHYWLLSDSGSSIKPSVPCNVAKGVQVFGVIFYELSAEEKEKGIRSTKVFSSYLFFWCFELRQSWAWMQRDQFFAKCLNILGLILIFHSSSPWTSPNPRTLCSSRFHWQRHCLGTICGPGRPFHLHWPGTQHSFYWHCSWSGAWTCYQGSSWKENTWKEEKSRGKMRRLQSDNGSNIYHILRR